jgi:hypothetical protein
MIFHEVIHMLSVRAEFGTFYPKEQEEGEALAHISQLRGRLRYVNLVDQVSSLKAEVISRAVSGIKANELRCGLALSQLVRTAQYDDLIPTIDSLDPPYEELLRRPFALSSSCR